MNDSNARPLHGAQRFSRLTWVAETGSTNADLLEVAREGGAEQTLVADHQTGGRGRLDRTWEAPPGSSLLMSVLVRPHLPAAEVPLLTMAMAVAVRKVLSGQGATVDLKWPNDLVAPLADDPAQLRKVAGVLAETVWEGSAVAAAVIGVGVNVDWSDGFPDHLTSIATSLQDLLGGEINRRVLAHDIMAAFGEEVDELEEPGGASRLVDRCRPHMVTLGRRVEIMTPEGPVEGVAVDLTGSAALVVDTEGGRREVAAGDVGLMEPPAAQES